MRSGIRLPFSHGSAIDAYLSHVPGQDDVHDAGGRLRVLLRVPDVQDNAAAPARRLLRILLVR